MFYNVASLLRHLLHAFLFFQYYFFLLIPKMAYGILEFVDDILIILLIFIFGLLHNFKLSLESADVVLVLCF